LVVLEYALEWDTSALSFVVNGIKSGMILPAACYKAAKRIISDLMKKKKNFIKPQYNNSLDTQHCGRLPQKTKCPSRWPPQQKNTNARTHTEKEITYEHKTTKKERKDSEIT